MVLPSENPMKCHEEVLYSQPMVPPKLSVLTFFPPEGFDSVTALIVSVLFDLIGYSASCVL